MREVGVEMNERRHLGVRSKTTVTCPTRRIRPSGAVVVETSYLIRIVFHWASPLRLGEVGNRFWLVNVCGWARLGQLGNDFLVYANKVRLAVPFRVPLLRPATWTLCSPAC